MSSNFTKVMIAHDVWAICDTLQNRVEKRREVTRSLVHDLMEAGYLRALDELGELVHELAEFTVLKEALKDE